jgi:hypothetical protein
MVKIYHPPSSEKSSVEFIDQFHLKRRVETENVSFLEPLKPKKVSLEFLSEESNEERSKPFSMMPPSMQRQKAVQNCRKWGLVSPSLVRQSRGERESRRKNDETRDASSDVSWVFSVRKSAKESEFKQCEKSIMNTPPWLAQLIRTPGRLGDVAPSKNNSNQLASNDGKEKKKVFDLPECSPCFSKLNICDGGFENDIFAFSLLHQLMNDSGSSSCSSLSFNGAVAKSMEEVHLPGERSGKAFINSQQLQQNTSCFAISKWCSDQHSGKPLPSLPMNDRVQHADKMTASNTSGFPTLVDLQGPVKSLEASAHAPVDTIGQIQKTAKSKHSRWQFNPDPAEATVVESFSKVIPSPAHERSKEQKEGDKSSSAVSDTTNPWFAEWLKSLGPSKPSAGDKSVSNQEALSLLKQTASPVSENVDDDENVFDDPFWWVDRIFMPFEFTSQNRNYDDPFEPEDDDGSDDIEPDDDDDDDDDFQAKVSDDCNLGPAVQQTYPGKSLKEQSQDEPSVVSTKSVKRVRFNMGDSSNSNNAVVQKFVIQKESPSNLNIIRN